jgi:hypothetical protein
LSVILEHLPKNEFSEGCPYSFQVPASETGSRIKPGLELRPASYPKAPALAFSVEIVFLEVYEVRDVP